MKLINATQLAQSPSHIIHYISVQPPGTAVSMNVGLLGLGMMAGDATIADQVRPLVEPLTSAAVYCGPVGSGLKAKYAINLFLVAVTAGLAESMNLARVQGLDLEAFDKVLGSCSLASPYSRIKIAKMLKDDYTQLIKSEAEEVGVQTPLIQICNSLCRDANDAGWSEEDMMAIYKLFAHSVSQDLSQ
ncbi:hypothetical protein LCI18_008444 [Fusarium solani-melongenae]|uniref:Uncharacterized protein n=1 Tax=Fusarium solani subsp. cucurbitae TaxID=2747967 RepID=A0ACD3Z890_FUSSC|nr:hypothetical protein LCI18_008444 [Fusarium solani-melongenae]